MASKHSTSTVSSNPAAGCCNGPSTAPHDHAHAHEHAHEDHGHDHDHTGLPGWRRLAFALIAAVAAEGLSFWAPDTRAWQVGGMALALIAIVLAGFGIYK